MQTQDLTWRLWWSSADHQDSMSGGDYPSEEAARAAIHKVTREFLDECATPEERDGILRGNWTIQALTDS